MYLPAGTYDLTVMESAGHETLSAPITVSTGQLVTGFSFYMQRTNVPIPEFPVALIGLVTAVGASMYVLRRARRRELMNGNVVCVKVEKELQLG
jgi:hypothetical protein